MARKYTYSFHELANLVARDKGLDEGDYHFDVTYNTNDSDKLLVVEISELKEDNA